MNILIVNLTRLGDLLQTQAAISDLARRGARVGVACLENFSGAAALLRDVAYVNVFPGAALLAALAETPAGDACTPDALLPQRRLDWGKAPARLLYWREELLRRFQPDVVCNLTPSLSARLLARFVAGPGEVTGFGMDMQGFGVNSSAWAAFLMGAAAARGVSPFNVVDLFRKATGGGEGRGDAALLRPDDAAVAGMRERLAALAPEGCAGFAAIQPGASEERRRWLVASFAAVGDRLWEERNLCPVLLGSAAERPLAEEYARTAKRPFLSLCGETSLRELAATLSFCRLLVTNDTGTMHLAAGLGVPILSIFLATAQPFDTGPYLEGSYCIEPDMPCHPCAFGQACPLGYACRRSIRPETLYPLALALADAGQAGTLPSPSGARIWQSAYDGTGFMSLRSLSGHEHEDRTQWFRVQRHMVRQFLDRDRRVPFAPAPLSESMSMSDSGSARLMQELREIVSLVSLAEQQGRLLLARPLPAVREKFLGTWNRVYAGLRQSPFLSALAILWLEETQAEGQDFPVTLHVIRDCMVLLRTLELQIVQ